jgi:hypothetical protein
LQQKLDGIRYLPFDTNDRIHAQSAENLSGSGPHTPRDDAIHALSVKKLRDKTGLVAGILDYFFSHDPAIVNVKDGEGGTSAEMGRHLFPIR